MGKFTIQYSNSQPELPAPQFFSGFGLPVVLSTDAKLIAH
jgi:photosystem I subunit 10